MSIAYIFFIHSLSTSSLTTHLMALQLLLEVWQGSNQAPTRHPHLPAPLARPSCSVMFAWLCWRPRTPFRLKCLTLRMTRSPVHRATLQGTTYSRQAICTGSCQAEGAGCWGSGLPELWVVRAGRSPEAARASPPQKGGKVSIASGCRRLCLQGGLQDLRCRGL